MSAQRQTKKRLTRFMNNLSDFIGHPWTFAVITFLIALWFVLGFFLEYDVWLDIIDIFIFTSTFLVLFVIQNSQNADTKAMQDKLDEIIASLPRADSKKEAEEQRFKNGDEEIL